MNASRLRTENLINPIGLGTVTPRFTWNCEGGKTQTAYLIVAKYGEQVIWESGKVFSGSMYAVYAGKPLKSRMQVAWSIRLWDEDSHEGESTSAYFEMGLLGDSDQQANWIAGNYKPQKRMRYPVDCFRKKFAYLGKIAKARLYASALGVYDVTLNGKRIEEFILAPGMTDYRKHVQYQTYDVTELIKEHNTIELRLGDGWFRGCVAAYSVENVFGKQTAVWAQLEITDEEGRIATLITDESWAWSNDGSLRFADLKDGEVYDARMHPSYHALAKVVFPEVTLCASDNVYVKEHEVFSAKILKSETGKTVFDFGQNIAGYLAFRIKGRAGQTFKFICGETLGQNGEVDLSGVQEVKPKGGWNQIALILKLLGKQSKGETVLTPKQEIEFTCTGGIDEYKTSFSVFGFRYVQVEGEESCDLSSVKAIAVYSDIERTGTFSCSEERINKLVENTAWSMKGNFLDVPTDCPTRERLGWTGDAQIFFNTGAYLFDTSAFFKKWMRDMREGQYPSGLLSAVVPYSGVEMMYKSTGSSVGWADAVYLVPYRYYLRYGDLELLRDNWCMIQRYCDYLFTHTGMKDKKQAKENPYNKYTYEKGVHLGEWLEPEEFRDSVYGTRASHPEECTAYLYYAMKTIGEIAALLGEMHYEKKCAEYAVGAKKAYDYLFVKKGLLDTDRQAKLVRPLALGLVDGEVKKNTEERLEQVVKNYNYRVGTGFLSTPFLLSVLTDAGKTEIAYKVLENPEIPGWLAEVDAGATTVWESWEGKYSRNHYSLGAVVGWLFEYCAGIHIAGENKFTIRPVVGGSLTHAEAEYNSPYGKVISRWEKKDGKIVYSVEIPVNTTATFVSEKEDRVLNSGVYTFE